MRDGAQRRRRGRAADWTHADLVQAMVNRPITAFFPEAGRSQPGPPLLEVVRLDVPGRVGDVSFTLHAGEILGISGLVGAGRTEMLKALYGALPRRQPGAIRVGGPPVRIRSPRDAIRAGFALVPEDRKGGGPGAAVPDPPERRPLDARTASPGCAPFTSPRRISDLARKAVGELRIRTPGIRQAVRNLSGGNQQKVVLARAMTHEPAGLPARRADARHRHRRQGRGLYPDRRLAAEGAGILVVSSELLELLGVCDRILVMRAGRLAGEVERRDFSQERIMALAALG